MSIFPTKYTSTRQAESSVAELSRGKASDAMHGSTSSESSEHPLVPMEEAIGGQPHTATQYFAQDFKWEDLRDELLPLISSSLKDSYEFMVDAKIVSLDHNVKAWNKFHELHGKNLFFKERRYLVKEFPELLASETALTILEIGCGTGSSVLPILRANKSAVVYACDCSDSVLKRAHNMVQNSILPDGNNRFIPFLCEVSVQNFPPWLHCSSCTESKASRNRDRISLENDSHLNCIDGLDIITMIFILSSIPPHRMQHVVRECFSVLKPQGVVLFRDYGLYDMTMLRFSAKQRLGQRLYKRDDGTLTYFFTPEVLSNLFTEAGFIVEENFFCCVELRNRKRDLSMKRVWIHAKFMKPNSEMN